MPEQSPDTLCIQLAPACSNPPCKSLALKIPRDPLPQHLPTVSFSHPAQRCPMHAPQRSLRHRIVWYDAAVRRCGANLRYGAAVRSCGMALRHKAAVRYEAAVRRSCGAKLRKLRSGAAVRQPHSTAQRAQQDRAYPPSLAQLAEGCASTAHVHWRRHKAIVWHCRRLRHHPLAMRATMRAVDFRRQQAVAFCGQHRPQHCTR